MRRIETPLRGPVRVPAAEVPGIRALLTLQVGVVVIVALMLAREVLIPITLAMLLSFLLAPLTSLLRRVHLGRAPASVAAVVLALALIGGLLWLIGAQMVSLGSVISSHEATIERKLGLLRRVSGGAQWQVLEHVRAQVEHLTSTAPADGAGSPAPAGHVEERPSGPSPLQVLGNIAAGVLGPLATSAIVLVVTIFILLQREDLRDRMIRLFGARDLHRTTRAINDAATRLSRYFITQLAINAGFGCVVAIGLFLIGVPSPVLWGILSMLLRFVPYFGSILSALLPVLLSAAISPGWTVPIEVAVLFFIAESLTGQVIEPFVIGRRTGLSPVAVVIAATFWTWMWGPLGLVLSTPLTLCFVAIGRHVDRLEFLEVLFGDRPALSPIEGFYQRMLAGDPDEAVEQAERLLRDRSLSSYYDEVVVAALRLAEADALRGVLEEDQRGRIVTAVTDLLEELDEYDDVDPQGSPVPDAAPTADADDETAGGEHGLPRHPAPAGRITAGDETLHPAWRGSEPVLCVPGTGAVDELSCALLAQVLRKHGIGTRIAPAKSTARVTIGTLDLTDTALICLCVAEVGAQAAHLRYACRRLRRVAPGATLVVAFWPDGVDAVADRRLREVVDADLYAGSTREIVQLCLDQAAASPVDALKQTA